MADSILQLRVLESRILVIKSSVSLNLNEVEFIDCNINIRNGVDYLIQQLQRIIGNDHIKAVAIVVDVDPTFSSFDAFVQFRQKLRNFCQILPTQCFFYTTGHNTVDATLCRTKLMLKEGQKALVVQVDKDESGGHIEVDGTLVVKEPGDHGYRFVKQIRCRTFKFTPRLKQQFLNGLNPDVIVLLIFAADSGSHITDLKQVFKDENPVIYEFGNCVADMNETVNVKVLHDMGEKMNPYNLLPMCLIDISLQYGQTEIAAVTMMDALPFDKEFLLDVDPSKSITLHTNAFRNTVIQSIKMADFHCKKVRVLFKVDSQSFHDLKVVPVEDEKLDGNDLPHLLKCLL